MRVIPLFRYSLFRLLQTPANNIKSGDEAQQDRKKALFITMLGQTAFVKLRDLASPNDIATLTLDQVVALLTAHYRPQTIEIAERYKFFKRTQEDQERTTDFIAALRRLAKTCNFGREAIKPGIRNNGTAE